MQLQGKTVVVTGGSSGLGLSIAKALIGKGCQTHILARSSDGLARASSLIDSANLFTHSCDVSDYKKVEQVIKEVGDIDILINNAGIWLEGDISENSPEEIAQTLDINLKGVIYLAKAVLPSMIKNNDGYIINISSTSGLKPRLNQAIYAASKHGVAGFTQSLQEDLAKTNVKVAGFYPGGMSTNLFTKAGNLKDNSDWMNTDKVARIVIFMLEQDETMILDHVVVNKRCAKMTN